MHYSICYHSMYGNTIISLGYVYIKKPILYLNPHNIGLYYHSDKILKNLAIGYID